MKKRSAALFAILLAACLLFSSCAAAGLTTPALFGALKSSTGELFTGARDLLSGNTRIIDQGAAQFGLVCPVSLPDSVQEEAKALCAAVEEKTGAPLPLSGKAEDTGRAIFVDLLTPAAAVAAGVNDSVFRIYFAENDLHISASNEVMLTEALHHFVNTYIQAEDAAIGTGYFAIPGSMDVTCATAPMFDNDAKAQYIIVRPEKASEHIIDAAQRISDVIRDATGATVKIKSDFRVGSQESEQTEILVGLCNRESVTEQAAKLNSTSYYIGANGTSIQLLGKNEDMTEKAVEAFLNTFVLGSVSSAQSGQLLLPCTFSYTCKNESVALAENGSSSYLLIYAADASPALVETIHRFSEVFYYYTGATLPAVADTAKPVATDCELRVGQTDRGTGNADIAYNAWQISLNGDTVVINGGCDEALIDALTELIKTIPRLIFRQNTFEVNSDGFYQFEPYSARLLALSKALKLTGTSAVEPPAAPSEE